MEKWLSDVFPILDVAHDCIVSKKGDITVGYKVELPEVFTLSSEDYEAIHQTWVRAIKVLPNHCILHKQDWFVRKSYKADFGNQAPSFLSKASAAYFEGRPYLDHNSYIYLTKRKDGRKHSTSIMSSLLRPTIVPEQLLNPVILQEFLNACGQFRQILQDSGLIRLTRLRETDILSTKEHIGLLERYCFLNGSENAKLVRDIELKEGLRVGGNYCQLYTLADAEDLPAYCGSRVTFDRYSTDNTKFSVGFTAALGLLLPCDHIYNQYILIEDAQQTIKKLETKRLRLQSLSAYSRENAISRDATNDFLNEAISEQRQPVKAHFNVVVWTSDKEELKNLTNMVSAALAQIDAVAKEETWGAPQIFWAGIPGNGSDLPINDTFDTFAAQAACFLNAETNYRSDPPHVGVRFCDRMGRPVFVDMFDAPRKQGISSNMGMLVCGTSGGGKSMTVNHILRTLYDQGAHCVIVDIGGSYRGLNDLVGGYYFTYTEDNPIRFNPFYLPKGDELDTEKKESLKSLLVALWKQDDERFNRTEYVALSNALQGYFQILESDPSIFPCFNTFYDYLKTDYRKVLEQDRVKDKEFDIDNFLYVLRPFYLGGEFDYLLNARENLNILNQQFIVIELDNIKDHPILFPVVTLIIMELFISKMRKLKGVRKVLTIDEAWKAIAKSSMAEFLKYAFKTIRKFNGVPIVITQELDDLINSEIIRDAIINNADIKILMDMRKFVNKFEKIQGALGMSEKGKIIQLSVNKDNREIYLEIGGQIMKVLKNELCPEEYYAFTTEGRERVKVLEYAEQYGSMEAGITALVREQQNHRDKNQVQ